MNRNIIYFLLGFICSLNIIFGANYYDYNNSNFYTDSITLNEVINNFKKTIVSEYNDYDYSKLNDDSEYQILSYLKKYSILNYDLFRNSLENIDSFFDLDFYIRDDSQLKFYIIDDLNKAINIHVEDEKGSLSLNKFNSSIIFENGTINIRGNVNNFDIETLNYYYNDQFVNFSFLNENISLNNNYSGKFVKSFIVNQNLLNLTRNTFKQEYGVEPLNVLTYFNQSYINSKKTFFTDLNLIADQYSLDPELFIITYMQNFGIDILNQTNGIYYNNYSFPVKNYFDYDNPYFLLTNIKKLVNKGYLDSSYMYYFYAPLVNISVNISHYDFIKIQAAMFKSNIEYIQIGDYNYYDSLDVENKLFAKYMAYDYNEIQIRKMLSQDNFFFGKDEETKYYKPLKSNNEVNLFRNYLLLQKSSLINRFNEVLGGIYLLKSQNLIVTPNSNDKVKFINT